MTKLAKLSIPIQYQELINELEALPKEECRVLQETKLIGVETVVLITAVVQLTKAVIDLIAEHYKQISKKQEENLIITIDGEKVTIEGKSQAEIKVTLTNKSLS